MSSHYTYEEAHKKLVSMLGVLNFHSFESRKPMEEVVGMHKSDPWINMGKSDRNVDDASRERWMEMCAYLITAEASYLGC